MIILGCQAEDGECTTGISFRLLFIVFTEQTGNGKFAAFDPQARSFADGLKCHHATVGTADEAVWVVGGLDWTSGRLEFSVDRKQ